MSRILDELDRLHKAASVYSFHSNSSEDAEWVRFIEGCQKHLPALIQIARAAESVRRREEIGYGHEGIPDLIDALEELK